MGLFYFIVGVIVGTLLLILLPVFIAMLGVALAIGVVLALPLIAAAWFSSGSLPWRRPSDTGF